MVAQTTPVPFPSDLLAQLEPRAKKFGMTVPVYLAFLARVEVRGHDAEFVRATKHLLASYPEAMKRLAE